MSDKEKDQVLGHQFDGIEEYDNDLPRWWLNIFWVTAVFAVVYAGYMHGGYVEPDDERLEKELAALEAKREPAEVTPVEGASGGNTLLAMAGDKEALTAGKSIFEAKCAACHRPDGGGLVGPNLTDEYWIHGGSPEDIKQVVLDGVPEKGMIPWKTQLSDTQVNQVVAFIISLKGSNPANPKEPQGEKEAS